MKSIYIVGVASWLILLTLPVASHAALKMGGEIFYTCQGNNQYEVTVRVYRLCVEGTQAWDLDSLINLFVFTGDGSLFRIQPIPLPASQRDTLPIDQWLACMVDPKLTCMEVADYKTSIYLPPSPEGYDLSWATCCRWGGTINMAASHQGMTLTAHVPDSQAYPCNSSPVFTQRPPLFLCADEVLKFDYSAFDPDGDSLVYQLSVPYKGVNQDSVGIEFPEWFASVSNPVGPPPYQTIDFRWDHDIANYFGEDGMCEIDAQTGMITLMPTQRYDHLLSVSVFEYRNGVLLGEVRRDFQFKCNNCVNMGMAPAVSHDYGSLNLIQDTLQIQPGEAFCFQATFSDTAAEDQVLTRKWGSFQDYDLIAPTLANPVEALVCWEADCESQQERFPIILYARDTADCPYYRETFDTTWVRVNAPTFAPPSPSFRFPQSTASGDTLSVYPDEQVCVELLINDPDQSARIDRAALEAMLAADSMIHRYSVQATDSGAAICLTANCGSPPYRTSIWVSVMDTGACAQTYQWRDTVWLQTRACEISFPNVFTPNQDGVNELFRPFDMKGITVLSLEVYDRWGRRVYQDAQPPIAWNGWHANLKIAPEGVYFYVFTYQETGVLPTRIISKRGQVTLLR